MSNLAAFKGPGGIELAPAGLTERLVWLSRFGKPRLGIYGSGGGWHASVDMHVTDSVKGTSFEVKSDFDHVAPDEAVGVLIERLLSALSTLAGA